MPMDSKKAGAKLFEACPTIQATLSELGDKGWNLITVIERVVGKASFFPAMNF
jgi:hypothetical protein